MIDGKEMHDKIVGLLEERGPSLPMGISKALRIDSLFVSAFLSELVREKRVRMSSLRVGGSSLYYLEGQEERLGEFSKYLHPRELEAFLLLKKNRVLKDEEQDPATRVALRSLKDFAVGFTKNDMVYWKYVVLGDEEVEGIVGRRNEDRGRVEGVGEIERVEDVGKVENRRGDKKEKGVEKSKVEVGKEVRENSVKNNGFENPLIINEKKKVKGKSGFVLKVIGLIEDKGIKIVEEKGYKVKEYNCVVEIKSELGPIRFLTRAKDKKMVNEGDLRKLLSEGQKIPLPVFMLYSGDLSKRARELVEEYGSVLKAKRARLE